MKNPLNGFCVIFVKFSNSPIVSLIHQRILLWRNELARLIENELGDAGLSEKAQVPDRLLAWQSAEATLRLIRIWLRSSPEIPETTIASRLRQSAHDIVEQSTH